VVAAAATARAPIGAVAELAEGLAGIVVNVAAL
jgi:hypothetical protein